ncbi:MAG TPA: glutamine amidotransferase [Gammaproteobacteria bacterium]|nr:glutamine amidotransferase [Gammaproteobacteria bacterium]
MKTLLAIRHVPFEDLGSFAAVLAKAGYSIRYADAPTADFTALGKLGWDLVAVMGGPIGVNDGADYPFIAPELKFVEARLKAGLPLLGICLGSQFIAKALGATVRRNDKVELGWKPLTLTEAGRTSALRHLTAPVLHWHGEVFDLPQGALSLCNTDLTPHQGFSWGRALAMQFHPEVTASGLEQWYVGNVSDIRSTGTTTAELRRDAQAFAADLETQGASMLRDWLAGPG